VPRARRGLMEPATLAEGGFEFLAKRVLQRLLCVELMPADTLDVECELRVALRELRLLAARRHEQHALPILARQRVAHLEEAGVVRMQAAVLYVHGGEVTDEELALSDPIEQLLIDADGSIASVGSLDDLHRLHQAGDLRELAFKSLQDRTNLVPGGLILR